MAILTADAQSLLLRRAGRVIAQTRDEASLAWTGIKLDVARRGVSGGTIENKLLQEKVQSGLPALASRLQGEVVDVLRAVGLKASDDLIPEILSLIAPLVDQMEKGMAKEFGGVAPIAVRLTARLTSDLNDLALLNKVQAQAVPPVPANGGPAPSAAAGTGRRFRVSLSFAGERRKYVRDVAERLAQALARERVLYDQFHEAEFARSGLNVYLPDKYRKESDLIVVFISKEYDEKPWTGLEWRSIMELIAEKRHSQLMFLRFDNSTVEGLLSGDGSAWIGEGASQRPSLEIAELILERLRLEGHIPGEAANPTHDDWLVIAKSDEPQWKRVNAIGNLQSQEVLLGIAEQEGDGEVRRAAVRKLLDQDVLLRFARTDPYPRVRMAAAARLTRSQDIEAIRANERNQDVLHALPAKGRGDD